MTTLTTNRTLIGVRLVWQGNLERSLTRYGGRGVTPSRGMVLYGGGLLPVHARSLVGELRRAGRVVTSGSVPIAYSAQPQEGTVMVGFALSADRWECHAWLVNERGVVDGLGCHDVYCGVPYRALLDTDLSSQEGEEDGDQN